MQSQQHTLNKYQIQAANRYNINPKEFITRSYFNSFEHAHTLHYLLIHKKLPIIEALDFLMDLTGNQAQAMIYGLDKKEVIDLTADEISGIIKFGLIKDCVKGLNKFQIKALIRLRQYGLTADMLRKNNWITSKEHIQALGYLLSVKHYTVEKSMDYLAEVDNAKAKAICVGLTIPEINGLSDHCLHTFVAAKKLEWLKNKNNIKNLTKAHIKLLKELHAWGVTSKLVKQYLWLNPKQCRTLIFLVKNCFMSFIDAIAEIEGLDASQLYGIRKGLRHEEVNQLNKYQIKALLMNQTALNRLCADTFVGKTWFNSMEHVHALKNLLEWRYFTIEEAMEELDGLTSQQACQIKEFERRDNIVGLNSWMSAAVKENKYYGLTGNHLRDKNWFNSDLHWLALTTMISHAHQFNETMLLKLEKLDNQRLKLIAQGLSFEKVSQELSEVQIQILSQIRNKFYFINYEEVLNANWLKTDAQFEAFTLLYKKMDYNHFNILKILLLATKQKRIDELLNELHDHSADDFWQLFPDITQLPFFKKIEPITPPHHAIKPKDWYSLFPQDSNKVDAQPSAMANASHKK